MGLAISRNAIKFCDTIPEGNIQRTAIDGYTTKNIVNNICLEILCAILDNFSRQELLNLQLLCRRWDSVIKSRFSQRPLYMISSFYTAIFSAYINSQRISTSYPSALLSPLFIRVKHFYLDIKADTFKRYPFVIWTLRSYSHVLTELYLCFDSSKIPSKKKFQKKWRIIFNLPYQHLFIFDSNFDRSRIFLLPGIEQCTVVNISCNKFGDQSLRAVKWLFKPSDGRIKRLNFDYYVENVIHPDLAEGLASFIEILKESFVSWPVDLPVAEFNFAIIDRNRGMPTLENFYLHRTAGGGNQRLALFLESNEFTIKCRYVS